LVRLENQLHVAAGAVRAPSGHCAVTAQNAAAQLNLQRIFHSSARWNTNPPDMSKKKSIENRPWAHLDAAAETVANGLETAVGVSRGKPDLSKAVQWTSALRWKIIPA
jgi:hypothetical protein